MNDIAIQRKPSNRPLRKKERIWELDFLRGVCVLLMIFDHTMYDLSSIFFKAWSGTGSEFLIGLCAHAREYYTQSDLRAVFQPLVVAIFCALCGISCSFSRSNLKRGIEVGICAGLVQLVTTLIGSPIRFGILHMFTVAILLWWLIDTIAGHHKHVTAAVCFCLGALIVILNYVLMGLYQNGTVFTDNNDWLWLGEFMHGGSGAIGEFSSDYQPVFPLVGYMLLGASFAPLLYPKRRSLLPLLGKYDWYRPFSFWGKIALPVYVLHQVVIATILALISFLFITPGDFVII